MFKATEVEKKNKNKNRNKGNRSTYRYANKSLFVQNFRPLFTTVSPAIVMQTR